VRLLLIHAEEFNYEVKDRAVENPEPISKTRDEAKNALVVFISVEKNDVKSREFINQVVDEILSIKSKVNASSIVVYPYAHLSQELARPDKALEVLNVLYEELRKRSDVEVVKAPFGYYKAFTIKCFGHPLSELSRTITPKVIEEEKKEEKVRDYYLILTPEGKEYEPEKYEFTLRDRELKILVDKEVFKKELVGGKPRYLDYCRKFGFEWEDLSDIGHMRYGPEATLMLELVEEYSWKVVNDLGIPVFKVKGTNMFKLSSKAISEHAKLFGERLYTIRVENDELILRYAACFQQFSMLKDWVISYRDLPFGIFEVADSYRFEQPGETVLCFRLRKFYMPDLHVINKDLNEAMIMGLKVHEKIFKEIRKIGRDYVTLYNVTEEFYTRHRDYLIELAKREGKPILVRVLSGQKYYWVLNAEYNIIDELERPREIATLQIDVGNAERFGIKYRDEAGNIRYPVIIHTAIIGSIERYIYALLDKAAIDEKSGKIPKLPTWLCPVQVRLIPISREYLSKVEEVAKILEEHYIRVDIDDRDETVSKKVRDAETSWIPYIVVIGEKEIETEMLSVRIRGVGVKKMKIEELVQMIKEEVKDYPVKKLTIPKYLSKRPMYK